MSLCATVVVGLSCIGWLAEPSSDPDDPVAVPPPVVAAPAVPAGDADVAPDPDFWRFDPKARSRDWLDKPPIDPWDLAARPDAWEEVLASHGVALDLDQRTVYLRGATIQEPNVFGDPIEYLVVTEVGKTHEALFLVRAQPSVLNACLAAIGLAPGGHTSFETKDPPPPQTLVDRGEVSPWLLTAAHGPLIDITVTWVDENGRGASAALESMLIDMRTGEPLPEQHWIFTGSRFGSYRSGRDDKRWFKADVEGDIVAIYLANRDSCLFERNSLDGLEDSYYFPNPNTLPPRHTSVTVLFSATEDSVAATPPQEGPTYDWSELDEELAEDESSDGADEG